MAVVTGKLLRWNMTAKRRMSPQFEPAHQFTRPDNGRLKQRRVGAQLDIAGGEHPDTL